MFNTAKSNAQAKQRKTHHPKSVPRPSKGKHTMKIQFPGRAKENKAYNSGVKNQFPGQAKEKTPWKINSQTEQRKTHHGKLVPRPSKGEHTMKNEFLGQAKVNTP